MLLVLWEFESALIAVKVTVIYVTSQFSVASAESTDAPFVMKRARLIVKTVRRHGVPIAKDSTNARVALAPMLFAKNAAITRISVIVDAYFANPVKKRKNAASAAFVMKLFVWNVWTPPKLVPLVQTLFVLTGNVAILSRGVRNAINPFAGTATRTLNNAMLMAEMTKPILHPRRGQSSRRIGSIHEIVRQKEAIAIELARMSS